MSTYYSVYVDEDIHENELDIEPEFDDEGEEMTMTINVEDIPKGTKKLIFKVW
jgi:hypothetical protein